MAVSLGALATAAVIDLQLGALYDERGDLAESLAASTRCEAAVATGEDQDYVVEAVEGNTRAVFHIV